jgi:ribosomal protein L37AE/L43A
MSDAELDANPFPYLTTRRWVKEKYTEWGPGHPLWESRVLGNFPVQSEDALFSLTWLERAKLRTEGDGEVCAGLDVAGPGEDETVLCVRRGPRIVLLKAWTGSDPRGEVLAALLPFKSQLKSFNVDSVGVGYYMAQHLRDHGFPLTEINVGKAARDSEKYSNLKAELFWKFRVRVASGDLAGLSDDRTIAQLAGIRYSHNSRGQVVIESKDDARKRGVKSPDRAEAVILAFSDVDLELGLIEFLKEEINRVDQDRIAPPRSCPRCSRGPVFRSGDAWVCYGCRAVGLLGQTGPPPCPKCQSSGVTRVQSEWRCSQCGNQFGRQASRPVLPSRYDLLG